MVVVVGMRGPRSTLSQIFGRYAALNRLRQPVGQAACMCTVSLLASANRNRLRLERWGNAAGGTAGKIGLRPLSEVNASDGTRSGKKFGVSLG
jgi:hypothetical protein